MAKPKTKQKRAPRGQVGPQTYEQVRKVADEKGIPLVKAFEEVAKATGRKASTVAVTYYRISRLKGGTSKRGRPRKLGAKSAAGKTARPVLSQLAGVLKDLQAIIAHQEKEIARLTNESRLADRIRKAFQE